MWWSLASIFCRFFIWRKRMKLYRLGVVGFLVGLYLTANMMTWASEEWLLPVLAPQDKPAGALRITLGHFRQPHEWGLSPFSLPRVLERMTHQRPGILAEKWLYVGLLATYLLLVGLVFLRFTQPPSPDKPDKTDAGAKDSAEY